MLHFAYELNIIDSFDRIGADNRILRRNANAKGRWCAHVPGGFGTAPGSSNGPSDSFWH